MNREKENIELILKSWAGTLTSIEERELAKLLKNEKWSRLKLDLENDHYLMGRFKEYGKYDTAGDFLKFLEQVRETKDKSKNREYIYRWVACAAIVCFILASWIFLIDWESDKPARESMQVASENGGTINRNSIRLILDDDEMVSLSKNMKTKKLDNLGVSFISGVQTLDYTRIKRDSLVDSLKFHTLIVPKGLIFNIVLEDSTKIYLNAETKIMYPKYFAADSREIFVEGEAYFEVKKDKNRPFIVKGNDFSVEVLGTSFNVMNYENEEESQITLLSGRVKMCTKDSILRLLPGEQVSLSMARKMSVKRVNTRDVVSWMNNKFNFEGEKLEVIMRKICRWYDVEVLFEDPALRERRFTGTPPNYVPLPDLLDEFLNYTTNIEFTLQDGVIQVKEK